MTDGTKFADRIAYGAGMVARKTGFVYDAYRAQSAATALQECNRYMRLHVALTMPGGGITRPASFASPFRQAFFDSAYILPGDYLVGPVGVLLVTLLEPPQPALVVETNEMVSIWRRAAPRLTGVNPYGGLISQNEIAVMSTFPACLTISGVSDRTRSGLSDDTKLPGFECILPISPTVDLRVADLLRDTTGRTFVINAAEKFGACWRLSMLESVS
ncbi:MAG: hypothetical protein B7Z78_06310 [Rhodospirillales bacterium 20-60-12]|nr:MAG: hypothetical protein B7Z78_06310 [Rhodospirillales bacterium 20-60-12]HQT66026.1 hypothetical protein [Acetobacteraceae bacterium]